MTEHYDSPVLRAAEDDARERARRRLWYGMGAGLVLVMPIWAVVALVVWWGWG